jgi:hypothetical protein
VAAGQSQRFYSGVRIFNWYYLSSPPQILRAPGVELETRGLICRPNTTNFLLLNPGFFFDASGPAQKAVLVPFFWGGFYDLFFSSKLFFNLRGISVGALSEFKILKMSGHVRKSLKSGTLYRKAGLKPLALASGHTRSGTCVR